MSRPDPTAVSSRLRTLGYDAGWSPVPAPGAARLDCLGLWTVGALVRHVAAHYRDPWPIDDLLARVGLEVVRGPRVGRLSGRERRSASVKRHRALLVARDEAARIEGDFGGMPSAYDRVTLWRMPQDLTDWSATRWAGVVAAAVIPTGGLLELAGATGPANQPTDGLIVVGVSLVLLASLPLAVIDRIPRTAALCTFTAAGAAVVINYPVGFISFAILVATALGAAATSRGWGVMLGVLGACTIALGWLVTPGGVSFVGLSVNVMLMGMAAVLGMSIAAHREKSAVLAGRAAELERLRDALTREAVAQERLRIAREVHDVVGHALAAIALHARLAQRSLERDRAVAVQSITDIAELASDALAETRNAVGQIRAPENAELHPQPTLGDLNDLVEQLRRSDVDIDLDERGAGPLPAPLVQAAAFRIVQESLSNVVKHARPAHVHVSVDRSDRDVRLEVRDDGKGAHGDWQTGNGLLGMQERVGAIGGTLDAGPAPDGGWRVVASLPVFPGRR